MHTSAHSRTGCGQGAGTKPQPHEGRTHTLGDPQAHISEARGTPPPRPQAARHTCLGNWATSPMSVCSIRVFRRMPGPDRSPRTSERSLCSGNQGKGRKRPSSRHRQDPATPVLQPQLAHAHTQAGVGDWHTRKRSFAHPPTSIHPHPQHTHIPRCSRRPRALRRTEQRLGQPCRRHPPRPPARSAAPSRSSPQ
jgi:hypothetical protein